MRRRKSPADLLAEVWYQHKVLLAGEDKRTAAGIIPGEPTEIMADVDVSSRVVADQYGQEVTVAATVTWHPSGPLPQIGQKITLPDEFGMKPNREIITVKHAHSGTNLTPDHIEVTLR